MTGVVVERERRGVALAGYAWLTALSVFGASAIGVALPVVAASLDLGEAAAAWILASFMLTFPIGTVLFGRLADLRGERLVFRTGMALFIGGSIVGAATPNFTLLVLGRLLQGLGSGAIPTLSSGKVAEGLRGPARAAALAQLTAVVSVASGVSPLVGGSLTQAFGWQAVIALPALAIVAVPWLDREMTGRPARTGRLDVPGIATLTGAVAVGLILLQSSSLDLQTLHVWGLLATGVLLALLVRWQVTRRPNGFLPRALVTDADVLLPSLSALCLIAAYLGCVLLVPMLLSRTLGWNTLQIGLAMAPGAAVGVLATQLVPRFIRARGRRITGLGLVLTSLLGVLAVATGSSALVLLVGVALTAGGSMGGQVLFLDAAMRPDGDPLQASSLGIFYLFLFTGGAVGAVLAGTLAEAIALGDAAFGLAILPVAAVVLAARVR